MDNKIFTIKNLLYLILVWKTS